MVNPLPGYDYGVNDESSCFGHHLNKDTMVYEAENRLEAVILLLRNIAVGIASVLFLTAKFVGRLPDNAAHIMRIAAYILGALAYLAELLVLTDLFRRKHHHRELFMPFAFGAVYFLLGIGYIIDGF